MGKILIEEINRNRKVMGVKPLTESQEIDLILEDINKEVLNEGWWETTKYALSKLGRYKADGKILGKTQATANAEGKIRDLLTKKGNEIIQQLDRDIREIDSEFPNNKSRVSFLRCIILVSQAYDSIVASTKLSPTDTKFLPIDAANVIIGDLRTYVKKFLDTDLTAAFSVMDHENIEGNLITEDELLYEAEPRSTKLNQAGKTGTFDSSRMKTLKSNKLPLLLAGAGVSLGGLSWLMDSVWGQRLIEVPTEGEKIKYLKNTIGIIQPGQGLTQWLNMFEGTGLNPNSTPQQFLDAVTKVGNGDLDKGIGALTEQGGIFRNPDAAKQVLEQIKNNPDGYKSLGEMFKGTWAGTGRSIGDTLVTVPGGSVVEIIAKKVTVPILKKILVTTAAGSASPIVGALGIGLIAAGALVKGMRIKGQKQSRAKTLNDLYQSLVDLKPTQENPSSGIIKTDGVVSGKDGVVGNNQKEGKPSFDLQLYINLKKYFQDIFNYKSQVNMDTYGKGGTSNLEKVYDKNTNTTQPTQQKQGRFPNPTTLTQSQLKSSIDAVVHNLLKEFVELKEASQVVNNTSLKAVDSAGLSSNQAKLFKTNFTKLSNIIKIISKYKSNNQPLKTKTKVMVDFMDNVIAKAKTNPISNMDLNTLLNSDEKSLKIFISDYYKTIYSTKIIRRGNKDIMTGLSSININKLSEASERIPSKSVMNKVYNDRRLFIKNLPIYINYMFEILLVLKDLNLKGENQNKTTNTQNQGNNQTNNQTTQANNQSTKGQETSQQGQETTKSGNVEKVVPGFNQKVSGSIRPQYFR
jgi:hypothetical protein